MDDCVGCLQRDVVAEKEVGGGVGGAPEELGDLEDREGAFQGGGDGVVEGAEGVVGVLIPLVSHAADDEVGEGVIGLTIKACIPEFTNTNIQIGGLIYRIPAHIHSIAPA